MIIATNPDVPTNFPAPLGVPVTYDEVGRGGTGKSTLIFDPVDAIRREFSFGL